MPPRRLAWPIAWASIGAVAVGTVGIHVLQGRSGEDLPLAVLSVVGTAFFATIGALIAARTGNRIGWLYLGIIAVEGLALLLGAYSDLGAERDLPLADVAKAFTDPLFLSGLAMFVAVFLLFPDGRLASPRWRWVWWAFVVAVGVTFLGFLLQPAEPAADGLGGGSDPDSDLARNVLGVDALGPVLGPLLAVASIVIVLSGFSGLLCLVLRFRRGTSDVRQQIRWLLAVAVLAAVAFVSTAVTGTLVEQAEAGERAPSAAMTIANNVSFFALVAIVVVGIPLATTVAILRYRLYDLDLVIRKTVVFGLLAAFITVVYAVVVVAVSGLFQGSEAGSFVAAAVLAVAFAPARDRARRIADRLVFGKRATPYEVLAEFSERVGGAFAVEDVLGRMAQVLMDGTGASGARILVRVGGEVREEAAVGERGEETVVPVLHRGEELGALAVSMRPSDPMDPAKHQLMDDLAGQAGLVLRNVRLIEELRASQRRLVAAQDEERRRLERNIHDGVQQQLVALNVQLGLLGRLAERDPTKVPELSAQLQVQATETLEELRELARGIYPPLLADQGLVVALRGQSRRAAVPTTVEAEGIGRYDREVESAVYFSCLEALNNVAKYAAATSATITLRNGADELRFEIRDDGRGFDTSGAATFGTGLRGIADRLGAIGGSLAVVSEPGAGTTVAGTVPVEVSP
jgi:signal transduction histidine kinase